MYHKFGKPDGIHHCCCGPRTWRGDQVSWKTAALRAFSSSLVLLLLLSGCGGSQLLGARPSDTGCAEFAGARLVIVVIDGLRYSESFGDPERTYVPRMSREIRPHAALFENFFNQGVTSTNPGHTSMLTGTWQRIANNGSERPTNPTIFEYFRAGDSAPQECAWMIAGKPKLDVCSYSHDPAYGAACGAVEKVGERSDEAVVDTALAVLRRERPTLLVASLSDVDEAGHSGDWDRYIAAIRKADSLVPKIWAFLQNDPFYRGETYLLITNDHGRHDVAHGGFKDHGCSCQGCRHIMLLAAGPAIARSTASDAYTLRDICATAGEILGCPVPDSEGKVIAEMFADRFTGAGSGFRSSRAADVLLDFRSAR